MMTWHLWLTLVLFACGCAEGGEVAQPPAAAPAPVAAPAADREAVRTWLAANGEGDPVSARGLADEAFNDAMMASETGDPAAPTLLSAAIRAFEQLPALDDDGSFHLAVLQEAAGLSERAMATANRALVPSPTHLLLLGIGLRAARDPGGDPKRASAYATRLLQAWEGEQGARPEYAHHGGLLPVFRAEAIAAAELALRVMDRRPRLGSGTGTGCQDRVSGIANRVSGIAIFPFPGSTRSKAQLRTWRRPRDPKSALQRLCRRVVWRPRARVLPLEA